MLQFPLDASWAMGHLLFMLAYDLMQEIGDIIVRSSFAA